MSDEKVTKEVEKANADEHGGQAMGGSAPAADDGEFKITVKKLEMPVRPRGVLAE